MNENMHRNWSVYLIKCNGGFTVFGIYDRWIEIIYVYLYAHSRGLQLNKAIPILFEKTSVSMVA